MLFLSREKNESVLITVPPSLAPQVIQVTVIEVRGIKARLGFEAEKEVVIHRMEVQQRINAEVGDPLNAPVPVRTWKQG